MSYRPGRHLVGRYLGADMRTYVKKPGQGAVYGTFSGWDQYRAQIQLLAILRPDVAGDMAQSMIAFAEQNRGIWDRWLHLGAPTGVMTGDPAAPTPATYYAMGCDWMATLVVRGSRGPHHTPTVAQKHLTDPGSLDLASPPRHARDAWRIGSAVRRAWLGRAGRHSA